MEQSRLRSRVAVLCATALLHATVIAALLHKLPFGVHMLAHSNGHSTEELRLPRAVIVSLEYLAGPDGLRGRAPLNATTHISLQPVPIEVAELGPIPLPSEQSADPMSTHAPLGSVQIRCEVHVHQSLHGQVQAIDFGACTGDAEWQRTLIQSIERAAELVEPTPGVSFPPVRTFTVETDSLSPVLLARQLSTDDSSAGENEEVNSPGPERHPAVSAIPNR
jgi:hypothetical protein